jgi:DNA polymerase-4
MEDRSSARSLAVGSDLETAFYPLVSQLLKAAWTEPRPLRLVGVRFSGIEQPSRQLEIFGEVADKKRRLAGVLDKLNARGPLPAVHSGHQLGPRPS